MQSLLYRAQFEERRRRRGGRFVEARSSLLLLLDVGVAFILHGEGEARVGRGEDDDVLGLVGEEGLPREELEDEARLQQREERREVRRPQRAVQVRVRV